MKINSNFLTFITKKLFPKIPPRPWDVADGRRPDIFQDDIYPDFPDYMANPDEQWFTETWLPFWCALTNLQQDEIKKEAPNQEWIDWIYQNSACGDPFFPRHYGPSSQYAPSGIWGVPLGVALTTLGLSILIKYLYPFGIISYILWIILNVFLTIRIIKYFKMRSPHLAFRLALVGSGVGYFFSLFLMAHVAGSDLGSIEFLQNLLSQDAHWLFLWIFEMIILVSFTIGAAIIQAARPYSEAGDQWCLKIKLPRQILPKNEAGLTPYTHQNTNDISEHSNYEMLDGIFFPTNRNSIKYFIFSSKPTLKIIIFMDPSGAHDYITVLYSEGWRWDCFCIERKIAKSTTSIILKRYANKE